MNGDEKNGQRKPTIEEQAAFMRRTTEIGKALNEGYYNPDDVLNDMQRIIDRNLAYPWQTTFMQQLSLIRAWDKLFNWGLGAMFDSESLDDTYRRLVFGTTNEFVYNARRKCRMGTYLLNINLGGKNPYDSAMKSYNAAVQALNLVYPKVHFGFEPGLLIPISVDEGSTWTVPATISPCCLDLNPVRIASECRVGEVVSKARTESCMELLVGSQMLWALAFMPGLLVGNKSFDKVIRLPGFRIKVQQQVSENHCLAVGYENDAVALHSVNYSLHPARSTIPRLQSL